MKTILLIVRGICGDPDDLQEFEQHAVDWVLQDPYCREHGLVARADSYKCSPLTVWLREKERVKSFAEVLKSYVEDGWKIHLMAHSNGTRIVRDGLKLLRWPRVETLHFVCGACDSDFERTGFNWAVKRGRIERFFYYVAGRDRAMKIENTFLGKLDFALPEKSQPMGLKGPRCVDPEIMDRVIEASAGWNDYGHSTCWNAGHFEKTMRRIVTLSVGAGERSDLSFRVGRSRPADGIADAKAPSVQATSSKQNRNPKTETRKNGNQRKDKTHRR